LTGLFAIHCKEQWLRGPLRGYQTVEEEGPTLRGRWRVAEQMRRPGREHVLAMSYDSFSTDNPVNRLLRFVIDRLWQRTRDAESRRLLDELRRLLDEVTLLASLEPAFLDQLALPPWQEQLQPLLNLARLFLEGASPQLAEGAISSFAIVFDMNRIFES